jgi:hypothetical protein
MLILLVLSIIIGTIVAAVTGIGFLFWVVSIAFFIFGLPGALIAGFIHGENEYAQDRADYRELMRDIAEDRRAEEREIAEDIRMDRYLDKLDGLDKKVYKKTDIYIDNRQVNIYNGNHPRDKSGRFISTRKGK